MSYTRARMYCEMLDEYINKTSCIWCDTKANLQKDSWTLCTYRKERHPLWSYFRWFIRPKAFIFKTLLIMRWIIRKLSPKSRITIWSNKDGWHFGQITFSKILATRAKGEMKNGSN